MHLNIVVSKNAKQYYVIEAYRNEQGKSTTRIVKKLGSHAELLKEHEDPEAWAREVVEEMNRAAKEGKQRIMVPFTPSAQIEKEQERLYDRGYLFLQKLFSQLHLDYICKRISSKRGHKYNLTEILGHLVYARILSPSSKAATYEYAQSFLEKPSYGLEDLYRALEVIGEESDYIQSALYQFSKDLGKRNDGVLYYDCTNYYFEIEQERGMAKYGRSKENRPNPIVEMGLFMDGDGIPLAFCMHDGNTNEQKTLRPLEEQIMNDFGTSRFVVCTDAGLSSAANRRFNNVGDRAFVTAQSIKKMKAEQREWALSEKDWRLPGHRGTFDLNEILADEQLRKKYYQWTFYKEAWVYEGNMDQKYIVTFSLKYMEYQRRIRNEQISRAEAALKDPNKRERTRQSDYKRFIKKIPTTEDGELASRTQYDLDEQKILAEERFDGFYAVATNLNEPAEAIIRINQRRWEIEECFRIMKHEFDARPVYLRKDIRIKAHFTTCFLSLVLFRYLEKALGHRFTCEQIIQELRKIKFLKLKDSGFIPAYTRNDFTDAIHDAFGFHTDYEILTKATMRKIISLSKKR